MHEDTLTAIARLTDEALHDRLKTLAQREHEATVEIVAHLAVLLGRKKHLRQGWGSVFTWCRDVLGMSEDAAYNRVAAARAVRRFPVILEHLAAGFVSITAVKVLRPVLPPENLTAILTEAKHCTRKQCELIVARLQPKPDVPSKIRALPSPATAPNPSIFDMPAAAQDPAQPAPAEALSPVPPPPRERPTLVAPLSPQRYRLDMTMDDETHAALQELRNLLAREVPSGDPAAIVKRALLAHVREVRTQKRSATDRPRPPKPTQEGSRDIPAHVARAVWERDGERCAFVAKDRRCSETRYLELHHVRPFGHQGPPTVENIAVLCRAHNVYDTELVYGPFQKQAAVSERRETYAVWRESAPSQDGNARAALKNRSAEVREWIDQ